MKKRRILALIPMLGLFLTGCDAKEVLSNAKHWVSQNIYHPIKDLIDGKSGEEQKSEEESGKKEQDPTVTKVELDKASLSLKVGEVGQLSATVVGENSPSQEVTWFSSNEEVATVSGGKVTALKVGTAQITAKSKADESKVSEPCVVTVTESETPPSGDIPGSAERPYTAVEARAAVDAGAEAGVTGVYATGIVSSIAYAYSGGSMSFYFSDDGARENEVEAYKLTAEKDPDIIVGDTVVVLGNLTKYKETYEFAEGCTLVSHTKVAVSSISISGSLSKSVYSIDEAYSEAGLVATAHLENGNDLEVTSKATWSSSKALAKEGDESVEFTASYREATSEPYACAVTVSNGEDPQETQIYKLDGTITGGSSGYAEASTIEQGGKQWDVVGNTTMSPWRIGGKSLSGVDRTATSKSSFSDDITKVVVTTGTKTLSKLNSITLLVGSAEGVRDVDSVQLTEDLVDKDLTFSRPDGHDWKNRFFTVVFNLDAGSSNQYVQLKAITLFAMK